MSDWIDERAREFCASAFAPFGVDIVPYVLIVSQLLRGVIEEDRDIHREGGSE